MLSYYFEPECLTTLQEYIQTVHEEQPYPEDNEQGLIIICALKQQLELLLSAQCFEVHFPPWSARHGIVNEVRFVTQQMENQRRFQ